MFFTSELEISSSLGYAPFEIIGIWLIVYPCALVGSFLVLLIKKIIKYFQ